MRPARRTTIKYDGRSWEVMDERGKFLLIERNRCSYSLWIHKDLVEAI